MYVYIYISPTGLRQKTDENAKEEIQGAAQSGKLLLG